MTRRIITNKTEIEAKLGQQYYVAEASPLFLFAGYHPWLLSKEYSLGALVLGEWFWSVVGIANRYHTQDAILGRDLGQHLLDIVLAALTCRIILES